MQSFAITCEISVCWLMLGYSLAFGTGNKFIGGGEKFWFRGDDSTGACCNDPRTLPATRVQPLQIPRTCSRDA